MKPKKFTVGLRPSRKLFRVSTWAGQLIDELLVETSKIKQKTNSHSAIFQNVEQAQNGSHFRLVGDHHNLLVSVNDILYTADYYESENTFVSIEEEVDQFISFFGVINNLLKPRGIRRVGIVSEYRIDSKTELPSKELLEAFTKIERAGYPAKFQVQFESRHPIQAKTGIPDLKTDDFWNIIETYYDGEADTDHSTRRAINTMLDVQRYYNPLLNDKFEDAIRVVLQRYQKEAKGFEAITSSLGAKNGDKEK